MFSTDVLDPQWINDRRKGLGNCGADVLETTILAFILLGRLAEKVIPFVFKGGTSLLLHVEPIRRLSRDIDIVCSLQPEELDPILAEIGSTAPFTGFKEDVRDPDALPNRRHFKFSYQSRVTTSTWATHVLLDVVVESSNPHTLIQKPVGTSFLVPERTVLVTVPTVESLLGEKLTAFAPHTIGVPLYQKTGAPGDVMQVAKQLFDVAALFDAATSFDTIASTYSANQQLESGYRGGGHTREAALEDTWKACLSVIATNAKKVIADSYPDGAHLHTGLSNMSSHLTAPAYSRGTEARQVLAAKCALLVAHLWVNERFNFVDGRWAKTADQLEGVRVASLSGSNLQWLDRMKAANPEAYFYLHKAVRLLVDAGIL